MAAKRAPPKRKYNFLRRQSTKDAKKAPKKAFAFGAPGAPAARKNPVNR